MAGHESAYNGVALKQLETAQQITDALAAVIPTELTVNDVVFLCIGTDRSTGDSLGPLVGTYLQGIGYKNVYGTLEEPVHALNLYQTAELLPADKPVIAIDACLGKFANVNKVNVVNGGIKPGAGVDKDLSEHGDYSIYGVVNLSGYMPYQVLQATRLSVVMRMAKNITSALVDRFPLSGERYVPVETVVSEQTKERVTV